MRSLLITLLLFFVSISYAKEIDFGARSAETGVGKIDLEKLSSQGHSSEKYMPVSGGKYEMIGRWVLGGEGFGVVGNEKDFEKSHISFGGYGLVKAGYVAYYKKNTHIFPLTRCSS